MNNPLLYMLIASVIIAMILNLILDIKSYKKNYYSKENKEVIKVNSDWYIQEIIMCFCFINLALSDCTNLNTTTKIINNIGGCIVIILFMIDIPLKYINKSKLYFYEKGISIPVGRLMNHLKLVSYDNIEEFYFEEYSKNKFYLTIEVFKSKTINYRINQEEKEKIISFVNGIKLEYKIKTFERKHLL